MTYLRSATVLLIILSLCTVVFVRKSAAETQITESLRPTESPIPISSGFQSINEDIVDEIIKPSIPHDNVVLQALDKITGRVKTINTKIGTKIPFGTLFITVQQCLKTLPEDAPEAAAYLIIEENNSSVNTAHMAGKNTIFQAWMLASNPSKSALEHPVYDIWIKDCKDELSDKNLGYKSGADSVTRTSGDVTVPLAQAPDKNMSVPISDVIDVEDIQDNPPFMSAEPGQ